MRLWNRTITVGVKLSVALATCASVFLGRFGNGWVACKSATFNLLICCEFRKCITAAGQSASSWMVKPWTRTLFLLMYCSKSLIWTSLECCTSFSLTSKSEFATWSLRVTESEWAADSATRLWWAKFYCCMSSTSRSITTRRDSKAAKRLLIMSVILSLNVARAAFTVFSTFMSDGIHADAMLVGGVSAVSCLVRRCIVTWHA